MSAFDAEDYVKCICWFFLAIVTINLLAKHGFFPPGLVLATPELLLLMVPAWYKYKAGGETETAKGIVIAAAIVFLLSADTLRDPAPGGSSWVWDSGLRYPRSASVHHGSVPVHIDLHSLAQGQSYR
jgi:hypothetical protein